MTWIDDRERNTGQVAPNPGTFSARMQAFLLELAQKSPFPLATVRCELSPVVSPRTIQPSRLNVLLGREPAHLSSWSEDVIAAAVRLRRESDETNNASVATVTALMKAVM